MTAGGPEGAGHMGRLVCGRCRHYYTTWDPQRPHGCKGFGFKSKEVPSIVVRRTDNGEDCRLYSPKTSAVQI